MSSVSIDPMTEVAELVADCLAALGYVFIEDDKVAALREALAETMKRFFLVEGMQVQGAAKEDTELLSRSA